MLRPWLKLTRLKSNYILKPSMSHTPAPVPSSNVKSTLDDERPVKRVKPDVTAKEKDLRNTNHISFKPKAEVITSKDDNGNSTLMQMRQIVKNSTPTLWKPIVWIDCEMTGLNVYEDHIIEICCIITDGNLNIIDREGYESTIYYPKELLDSMNEWCINQHGKSGLTAKVLANSHQTLTKVQDEVFTYIRDRVGEKNKAVMAGNSIHMDRFFMQREFPKVIDFLHYRLIDVSSIMEIGYRHNPKLMKVFPKKVGNHTAKSDILESISQLKWYRDNYLKSEDETRIIIDKSIAPESESQV